MKRTIFGFLIIICVSFNLLSQEDNSEIITEIPKFTLNGFARGSAFGGSETFDIANAFGEFGIKTSFSGNNTGFVADLRVRDGIFFGEHQTIINLKEAYAEYTGKYFEISLGNRIINYGKATGFNPTDNICPKDYFYISSDIEDMKMSNFMLKTNIKPVSQINIELVLLPFFKPSVYRYDLFDMSNDMGANAIFDDMTLPDVNFDNMSYSAHVNTTLSGIDFGLMFFNGYDPYYAFDLKNIEMIPAIKIIYQPAFYKKTSAGLDFSIPVKTWLISGELAYNHTTNYKDNIFTPNPNLHYVIGLEKDIAGVKVIAEYIGRYVFDFNKLVAPSLPSDFTDTAQLINYMNETVIYESAKYTRRVFEQYYQMNNAMMLSLHRNWLWETLSTELSFLYNLSTEEKLIRGNITWKANDELSISGGGQIMDGPKNTIYDISGKVLSGIWIGMKYSF
ncbi:MAG TPA: hypothetical protein PLL66_05935 [Bacteroidales bacterium]|nr:hypothetical protein [Bacteroidales bacterium]